MIKTSRGMRVTPVIPPKIRVLSLCQSEILGHNASVWYTTHLEEVSISDNTHDVYLTPQEALSLLTWLQREKATLEQLAEGVHGSTSQ